MSILKSITSWVIPGWVKWAFCLAILTAFASGGAKIGYDYRDMTAQRDINKINLINNNAQALERKQVADLIAKQHDISQQLQDALTKQADLEKNLAPVILTEITKPIYTQCVTPTTGVDVLNVQAKALNAIRGVK